MSRKRRTLRDRIQAGEDLEAAQAAYASAPAGIREAAEELSQAVEMLGRARLLLLQGRHDQAAMAVTAASTVVQGLMMNRGLRWSPGDRY